MLRKLIIALSAAFLAFAPAHAQTGSVKTPAALATETNALFPDQNAGGITPFDMRQTLLDVIASYATISSTPNIFANSITINPPVGIVPGLTINQSLSGGSLPLGNSANLIFINSDTAQGGAAFINGVGITHVIGGSAMTGGRQTFASFLQLASPTNASNTNRNYVANYGNFFATSSDGGTNTGAGAQGAGFPIAAWGDLQSGAINFLDIGAEFDISIRTGASAKNKHALSLISHALDQVSGASLDTLLSLGSQTGSIGVNAGITFDTHGGAAPTKTSGTGILVHDAMTMATFIDASLCTCTSFLKSTGITVDGFGGIDRNNNSTPASVPASQTNALARFAAADGVNAIIGTDAFGGGGTLSFRRADGTAASRTGVVANDILGTVQGIGYTSSAAYTTAAASIQLVATETYSSSANGSKILFNIVPNTTQTLTTAMTLQQSGGLSIGAAATDPGINNINASGVYKVAATQVVGARITGYTAMTGTPDKVTAYATSTVTLPQLAGRMMQLQADLTTHGLIGP